MMHGSGVPRTHMIAMVASTSSTSTPMTIPATTLAEVLPSSSPPPELPEIGPPWGSALVPCMPSSGTVSDVTLALMMVDELTIEVLTIPGATDPEDSVVETLAAP